jgi:hypothetical protein
MQRFCRLVEARLQGGVVLGQIEQLPGTGGEAEVQPGLVRGNALLLLTAPWSLHLITDQPLDVVQAMGANSRATTELSLAVRQ